MKKIMSSLLIVAVLFCWIPCARAEEAAQDLDPMVSPDASATVTGDTASKGDVSGKVTDGLGNQDAARTEKKAEKKKEEKKKHKTEKNKAGKKKADKKKQKTEKKKTAKKKQKPGKSATKKSSEMTNPPVQSGETQKAQ
jgi:outer membrane biosynthesis protein TonB